MQLVLDHTLFIDAIQDEAAYFQGLPELLVLEGLGLGRVRKPTLPVTRSKDRREHIILSANFISTETPTLRFILTSTSQNMG